MENPGRAKEFVTMRYMDGFRCLGPECEEHCCGGWSVTIDEKHYKKLKRTMSDSRAYREEFRGALRLVEDDKRAPHAYAVMTMKEDGNCSMLQSDGLCAIQGRFGEDALSDVCALYPRLFSLSGSRYEMAGTLSCPEVARRALLHEDALDLIDFDEGRLPSGHMLQLQIANKAIPYAGYIDDIRSIIYELLSLSEYSVSVRLLFATYFASRTVEFFHRDCAVVDEARLGQEISRMQSPMVRAELQKWYAEHTASRKLATVVILQILEAKLGGTCLPSFRELVSRILMSYCGPAQADQGDGAGNIPMDELIAGYYQRREALTARFGERIDRYFENYAKNYWMKEWYGESGNLLVHALNLLVRIAVLRFMLFSLAAIPAGLDEQQACALLDRQAVEVFYKFSRNIEHRRAFLEKLTEALARNELQTLAHAICFIKF